MSVIQRLNLDARDFLFCAGLGLFSTAFGLRFGYEIGMMVAGAVLLYVALFPRRQPRS